MRDHAIPPRPIFSSWRKCSTPYFDPSRPTLDCLIPPNGATSVEIRPVFTPTIPVSSTSATRHMRYTSRAKKMPPVLERLPPVLTLAPLLTASVICASTFAIAGLVDQRSRGHACFNPAPDAELRPTSRVRDIGRPAYLSVRRKRWAMTARRTTRGQPPGACAKKMSGFTDAARPKSPAPRPAWMRKGRHLNAALDLVSPEARLLRRGASWLSRVARR